MRLGIIAFCALWLAGSAAAAEEEAQTPRVPRVPPRTRAKAEPGRAPRLSDKSRRRPLLGVYGPVDVWAPGDLELEYDWKLPLKRRIRPGSVWLKRGLLLVMTERAGGPELWSVNPKNGRPNWIVRLIRVPDQPPYVSSEGVYILSKGVVVRIDRKTGEIAWRLRLPYPIVGNIAAEDPMVYGASNLRRFHALEVRWDRKVYKSKNPEEKDLVIDIPYFTELFHADFDEHIVNDPWEDGGVVYLATADRYMQAFNDRGEKLFRFQMQGPTASKPGTRESLAVFGSTDFYCYAIERFNGVLRWRVPTTADGRRQAAIDLRSNLVYYPRHENGLFAFYADDDKKEKISGGDEAWHIEDAYDVAGISEFNVYLHLSLSRLACVDKRTGYVRWISLLDGIREVVINHNEWSPWPKVGMAAKPLKPGEKAEKKKEFKEMRIYMVSSDNSIYCFREKERYKQPWVKWEFIPYARGEKPIPAPGVVPIPPGFPGAAPPPRSATSFLCAASASFTSVSTLARIARTSSACRPPAAIGPNSSK